MSSNYFQTRQLIAQGLAAPEGKKERKPIPKISEKKRAQMEEEKKARKDEDPIKEKWFKARRGEMTGICGCGCGEPSSKNDDLHFRSSAAHVFPKDPEYGFPSIAYHPLNWVERRVWGGCHANMDQMGLDKWPNMEDWPVIRERFFVLEKALTPDEKTRKFYHKLKELVENNPA